MFADATLEQPFVKFFYGSDNVPTQVTMLKQRIKDMRLRLDFEIFYSLSRYSQGGRSEYTQKA